MAIKVGINGMGRIGRMVIRAIIENQNKNIKIQHINNRSNSEASCTLIKYDSIHGKFNADLNYDENHLYINKNKITFFAPFLICVNNFSFELNFPVHSKT